MPNLITIVIHDARLVRNVHQPDALCCIKRKGATTTGGVWIAIGPDVSSHLIDENDCAIRLTHSGLKLTTASAHEFGSRAHVGLSNSLAVGLLG